MRIAVVYETVFGCTRQVAAATAGGLRAGAPGAEVTWVPVADAGPAMARVDLLVVGGPTHFLGLSSQRSRRMAREQLEQLVKHDHIRPPRRCPVDPGVREWLAALPQAASGRQAAAFDTRLADLFPGSAARPSLGARAAGQRPPSMNTCSSEPRGRERCHEHRECC